jgi:uncharacterized membrane protein
MIVFRFFHIVCGALWVGSAFLFVGFIGPSAAEVGPSAGPLLSVAVKKRKVAKVITWLGMITVTAGWLMWFGDMDDAGGLSDWLGTHFGLVLTIGAVLATAAFFLGYFGVGRNVERLVDLGDEIRASGAPPSDEQQARMAHIAAELKKHGQVDLVLLLLAVTAMSTARYW